MLENSFTKYKQFLFKKMQAKWRENDGTKYEGGTY